MSEENPLSETASRVPESASRGASLALAAVVLLLLAVEFRLLPALRHFWGLNLWQYLPASARGCLAGAALLLCWPRARQGAAARLRDLCERGTDRAWRVATIAACALAPLLLWGLSERDFSSIDARLMLFAASRGWEFVVPEIGATHLFRIAMRAHASFGWPASDVVRLLVCLSGGAALLFLARASEYLVKGRGLRAFVVTFALCGGIVRVFAGHIEVYAFVLAAVAAYVWVALAFIAGRCHWAVPCLTLGLGVWLHLSLLCLVPSLVLLPALAFPSREWRWQALRIAAGLVLVALPTLSFLVAMHATDHHEDLQRSWTALARIAGLQSTPGVPSRWVAVGGDRATASADYALLSAAQLKYLVNAFFLLAPTTLPVLAGYALRCPRRFIATPQARFLSACCLPLIAYAFALRPRWGPYDWELFSLTALCLSLLASHLLAAWWTQRPRAELAGWLIAVGLLFAAIPFTWIGISVAHPAGPFAHERLTPHLFEPDSEAYRELEPWL